MITVPCQGTTAIKTNIITAVARHGFLCLDINYLKITIKRTQNEVNNSYNTDVCLKTRPVLKKNHISF